jgi:hypothetical protein
MFDEEERFTRQKLNAKTALEEQGPDSSAYLREKERLQAWGEKGKAALKELEAPAAKKTKAA